MTQIILPRRSFLAGVAALLTAPAIIKAESLMPVRSIDHILYPMRGLVAYNIGTDQIMVHIDQANFELPMPKYGTVGYLTLKEIKRVVPQRHLDMLRPTTLDVKQQKNLTFFPTKEMNLDIKYLK